MKVINVFAQLFAIFAFLTLGSLLIIVAFHILSLEDALAKIQELYASPWQSVKTGFVGLFFIFLGILFSKMLLKTGRTAEVIIFQSEMGPIVVSIAAMEDVTKKVLKRFHLLKDFRIKTAIQGKSIDMKLRLVLWSGGNVPELLREIQEQVLSRVKKLVGADYRLEVNCDVQRIEDHEVVLDEEEEEERKAASV
jgi:uncharacterized alkaline shock family protein YloU